MFYSHSKRSRGACPRLRHLAMSATLGLTGVAPAVALGTNRPHAQAGAIGEPGYSPFVEVVFRGHKVVLDAPQVAGCIQGQAGPRWYFRMHAMSTVSYRETDGCYDNESVHYASFDSSNPTAAAIEEPTYTPDLNAVPSAGCGGCRCGFDHLRT